MATKVAIEVDIKTGGASDDIIALREELEKVKKTQEETTKKIEAGFKAAKQGSSGALAGFKKLGNGLKAVGKAAAIFTLIVAALNYLKDALGKNQKAADFLGKALTVIELTITTLINEAIVPLGEWLVKVFTNPQEALQDFKDATQGIRDIANDIADIFQSKVAVAVDKLMIGINNLRVAYNLLTGDTEEAAEIMADTSRRQTEIIEEQANAAEKTDKVVNAITETVKEAYETVVATVSNAILLADKLVALEKKAVVSDAIRAKRQILSQAEAEAQRQIRDDVTKTIEVRTAANEELGKILTKQAELETASVSDKLRLVDAQIESYAGITNASAMSENQIMAEVEAKRLSSEQAVALIQAQTELVDVYERTEGQRSEQLTNRTGLEKEAFDIRQELAKVEKADRELELLELEQHFALLEEQARLAGDTTTNIEGAKQEALAKLRKKFRDEDLANEKKLRDDKVKLQQSYLSATGGILGAIDQLVAASGNNSKQALVLQKTLAVAQIAIDTAKSIVAGIAGATTSASATGPGAFVATPVFIATTIATILAAVGSATAILNGAGGGGGSATVPSVSVPSATTAPAIQQATSGTTELGGAEQAQLAPIQAFVVETEVTGNQNNVNQIESQANFG
jgi:hypothetical protein